MANYWMTARLQLHYMTAHYKTALAAQGLQSKLFIITSWLLLLRLLGLLIGRLLRLLLTPWHCHCLNSRRRQGLLSDLKAFSQVKKLEIQPFFLLPSHIPAETP